MAGMLPGVGVHHRRKTNKQHRQESPFIRGEIPLTELRGPLITTISNLDETALRARQRLEQKLGCMYPSPRSGELLPNRSNVRNHNSGTKDTRLGSKLLGRQWNLILKRCKSYKNVCSVCLEDFQVPQQVMKLSCSHKYHSECILPWLATHTVEPLPCSHDMTLLLCGKKQTQFSLCPLVLIKIYGERKDYH